MSNEYYLGKGAGDLNIKAECRLLIQTYEVEDCYFFDASSSANVSKWTIPNNATMTYNNSESAYELTKTSNNGVASILLNNYRFDKSCKVSADIKLLSGSPNLQPRLTLFNENTGICGRVIYATTANVFLLAIQQHTKTSDGSSEIATTPYKPNLNEWYTMEVIYDNGTVTLNLKQNDTVLSTVTGQESILGTTNELGLVISFNKDSKTYFKNIKVKPL